MDAGTPTPPRGAPHPALIDRLLVEAANLGEEARTQLAAARDRSAGRTLQTGHELGIVTTCLGYSVAWLLEQKAVAAGEIAAASAPPLADTLASAPPPAERAQPAVIDLGRRTRAFARRIERLAAA
jgi:hypothetical protein